MDREHRCVAEQSLGDRIEVLMGAWLPVEQHDGGSESALDDEEGL